MHEWPQKYIFFYNKVQSRTIFTFIHILFLEMENTPETIYNFEIRHNWEEEMIDIHQK